MNNSTRIKLCKLRDFYLLIKLYDNYCRVGKAYQNRLLSKIMSEENISGTLLARVENNPCSIKDAYPKNKKDKAHFFHQLVTMMMEKGTCSIGEVEYCKHIAIKLGYDNIRLDKVVITNAMKSMKYFLAATSYFNNKDRDDTSFGVLDSNKIEHHTVTCHEAEEGVEYISKQYGKLSIEGELEALIFCSYLLLYSKYEYAGKTSLENSYYSILSRYITYKTKIEDAISLVNNRVQLYQHIKQDINQSKIIRTLFYDYPCCIDAIDKPKADGDNIVLTKKIEGLIKDMEDKYFLPF